MSIMTGNKVVPKLRFREFKDSWNKHCLKSKIHSIDSGWSPQCEAFEASQEEWGVLKTSSVVLEGFNQNANKKLPNNLEPKFNLQVVKGDILVTRAGPINRVGIVAHVNKVRPKIMLSDKLIRLKVNNETSSLFTSISLSLNDIKKKLISKSSGLAVSQTNISQKILLNTKLFFPSYSEQQKIASFLSAVDEKIQQLTKKKEILEDYKKGVMQKIFSQEIRFKNDIGNSYPDWEEKKIGELFEFKQGVQCAIEDQSLKNQKGLIRFIRIIDLTKTDEPIRYIEDPGTTHYITNDDLFMVRYGNVGLVGYGYEGVIANNLFRIIPKESKIINNKFFYFLFRFKQRQLESLASSSTMPALSFTSLKTLTLKLLSFEEQKKIANFLSAIDNNIESVSRQLKKTKEFKKGLLQQMFV
ncbi:restriction endonuclease subunit S [Flavobacteriaceae bacterium]|nr:restriction endonuclease subunit S [Flavobacteriaceae bacterium]